MEGRSKADMVYGYVQSKLLYLRSISDTGPGKGMLANLRRGFGKEPGELPELWGMIFDKMPDELMGRNEASNAEWAVYTALTLYALHSQSSEADMNAKDISVGAAAASLVGSEDDVPRILGRLNTVVTSNSPDDLAYHLRGLVQLFKAEGIGLGYARLAKEFYLFADPERANSIKLRWGRDFYNRKYRNEKEGE